MNKKILSLALAATMLASSVSYAATLKEYVTNAGSVSAGLITDGMFDYAKLRQSADLASEVTAAKAVKAQVVAEAGIAGSNSYAQYPTSTSPLSSSTANFDLKVTLKMDNVKDAYTELLNLTKVAVGENSTEYTQLLAAYVTGEFKVRIDADAQLDFDLPDFDTNALFTQGGDLFEFVGYDADTKIATFKVKEGKTVADLAGEKALDDVSFILKGVSTSTKSTAMAVTVKLLGESKTVFTEEAGVSDFAKINYESNEDSVYVLFRSTSSTGGGSGTVTPTTYTVKFETNGGNAIDSVEVTKDNTVSEPTAPEKEGYDFAGWYTDAELTSKYDFAAAVTKNMTLYAAWTEKSTEPVEPNQPVTPGTMSFIDVNEGHWFYDSVKYAVENNLMNGVSEEEFAPAALLNRAMLVTILYRADGEPGVNKSIPFADVNANAYYANAVIWAQQNGIVSGVTESIFAPENDIIREQIAAILYRYAQYKGYDLSAAQTTDLSAYTDAGEIAPYAVEAMKYAVGSGLIKGKTSTTLNPQDSATRAEVATILQRFIESNK